MSISCTRLPCRRTFISLLLNWLRVSIWLFVLLLSTSDVFVVFVFTEKQSFHSVIYISDVNAIYSAVNFE